MIKPKKQIEMKYIIPTCVTLLRLIAAPIFYYVFLNGSCVIAFSIFIFAVLTDIADGKIARKLNATSTFGAFLDVIIDFVLIIMIFLAFFKKQWYGIFVFIPIAISFINFIIGSRLKKPIYDPVGKYMGAFVMTMIGITLLIPYVVVRKTLIYFLAIFFVINIISRTKYLRKQVRKTYIKESLF